MFYRLFRGVEKYIVYGTFSSFGWLRWGVKGRQNQVENNQNKKYVIVKQSGKKLFKS